MRTIDLYFILSFIFLLADSSSCWTCSHPRSPSSYSYFHSQAMNPSTELPTRPGGEYFVQILSVSKMLGGSYSHPNSIAPCLVNLKISNQSIADDLSPHLIRVVRLKVISVMIVLVGKPRSMKYVVTNSI